MDLSLLLSKVTRKYDIRDIASQNIRKAKALFTVTTSAIERTKAINSAQASAILLAEYAPFMYPIEYTADGIDIKNIVKRKNTESGSVNNEKFNFKYSIS